MGNSLQDQLLKSGLASKKQSHQAKKSKKKKNRQQRAGIQTVDENRLRIEEAEKQRIERDRLLNQQKQEAIRLKALKAEMDQLIGDNRLEMAEGEVVYRFTDSNKIKQLHVTADIQKQLAAGRIRIALINGGYALVSAELAERISARDATRVIALESTGPEETEDDPYAGYEVPDDLMW